MLPSGSIDKHTACEDLKAFERRLTEVISHMQPAAGRWRLVLVLITVCTGVGAYQWLQDPDIKQVTFFKSLWDHLFFTCSLVILFILFLLGIHKRVVAPSITAARCRAVLNEFNMSCDDTGKLILKPRPTLP